MIGFFLYVAYNIRTIYVFSIVALYILVIAYNFYSSKQTVFKSFLDLIGMLFGIQIAGIPQGIINYFQSGKYGLSVPTNGLMLQQMYWGLQYQRYDTYINYLNDLSHPLPQVYFMDPVGNRILEAMKVDSFSSWNEYFNIFIHYPIDVLEIYLRHFVNFLFPCWPKLYIENLNSSKWLLGVVGLSIIFLGVLCMVFKCIQSNKALFLMVPIVIPSIMIISGAVEYRFSLGIYFYVIINLCFNTDWHLLKQKFLYNKWIISFIYIIFLVLVFGIWSSMLVSETVLPLFL